MGASFYLRELHKKKQSDVMRYLLRLRAWEYRQRPAVHRAMRPTYPEKARKLGYKSKSGIYIFRVRVKRGNAKRVAKKGIINGKPSNQGIQQRKGSKSLQALGEIEVGKKIGNYRILNSYWVAQDWVYKFYEVIMVDPMDQSIRNDPRLNWICKGDKKHREARGLTSATKSSRGLGRGLRFNKTKGGSRKACWKRNNTVSLLKYR